MKEVIQSCIQISDETFASLLHHAKKKEALRGQILFQPPRKTRKIIFVEKGILRGYKIIDGKDFTHHFYLENWFATDFESFLTNQPSSLFIETLSHVSYYEIQKENLLQLYTLHHAFEKLGRIIAEKAFLSTVEKWTTLQTLDLKKKYKNLFQTNQDLFQQVPQKYIASYLGVSEQSLSRIKSM